MGKKKRVDLTPNIDKMWMGLIKERLPDVTFIQFLKRGEEEFICIKRRNEGGKSGRDVVEFKRTEPNKQMRTIEWEHIYKVLKDRSYEHSGSL